MKQLTEEQLAIVSKVASLVVTEKILKSEASPVITLVNSSSFSVRVSSHVSNMVSEGASFEQVLTFLLDIKRGEL